MTTEQLQHLLVFLAYDTGGADGTYGPKTRQAVLDFQKEYGGLAVDGDAGETIWESLRRAIGSGWIRPERSADDEDVSWWGAIRYFRRDESKIACSCGRCGGFPVEPSRTLMELADRIRGHFDAPMTPTSTVRCPAHNRAVGGAANSRHLWGKAMDFRIQGKPAGEIIDYVNQQPEVRYAYPVNSRVVHMDVKD